MFSGLNGKRSKSELGPRADLKEHRCQPGWEEGWTAGPGKEEIRVASVRGIARGIAGAFPPGAGRPVGEEAVLPLILVLQIAVLGYRATVSILLWSSDEAFSSRFL